MSRIPEAGDILLHLDASDVDTLYASADPPLRKAAVGEVVRLWVDKSGQGNHAVLQADPTILDMPVRKVGGIGTNTTLNTLNFGTFTQDAVYYTLRKWPAPLLRLPANRGFTLVTVQRLPDRAHGALVSPHPSGSMQVYSVVGMML